MSENEKSPGCCEHLGEQISLTGFCEIPLINDDYTPERGTVSRLLMPGRSNAVTLQTLEKWMDLDGRTIRRMIEAERRQLVPIVADNCSGYFLAETEFEKKMCARSMENRAREILETAYCIDRADVWRG